MGRSDDDYSTQSSELVITNDLLVITMGIAFYLIPLILVLGISLFLWRWRGVSDPGSRGTGGLALRPILKDPIAVTLVLGIGGFVMVAFLTGRFSFADYLSVPADALDVLWQSLTDWRDPLSSESIALRGGVLIAIASAAVVSAALLSYFRGRLRTHVEERDDAVSH
ncbi:MAG: hypothetical protein M3198_11280 [Actinomycetota bacterium]|nr:hypothetical protein [Actinomycetota bacterium]